MTQGGSFRSVLRTALDQPLGAALGVAIPVPAFTVMIVCGDELVEVQSAAEELLRAFGRDGRPPGRIIVLLPPRADGTPELRRAVQLRTALGIPVIAHDPETSPCYVAGHGPGHLPLEFDDELREAEAVVLLAGPCREPDGSCRPPLCAVAPGMLSGQTCRALEVSGVYRRRSRNEVWRAAADFVPVDFALLWWRGAGRTWLARSGPDVGAVLDPSMHGG